MLIKITVKRQSGPDAEPHSQTFSYEGDGNLTVADWLTMINQTEAEKDRIAWECGCMEKKCGACAMRINGIPRLACSTYFKDCVKRGKILLEPLSRFPLVKDLVVDRSTIFSMLGSMKIWTQEKTQLAYGQDLDLQYKAGQCLQCGCCLEICPNFRPDGGFAGAAAMLSAYKALEQNRQDGHRKEMAEAYRARFFSGCGQSLSCVEVCPIKLPLDEIQARANSHK